MQQGWIKANYGLNSSFGILCLMGQRLMQGVKYDIFASVKLFAWVIFLFLFPSLFFRICILLFPRYEIYVVFHMLLSILILLSYKYIIWIACIFCIYFKMESFLPALFLANSILVSIIYMRFSFDFKIWPIECFIL